MDYKKDEAVSVIKNFFGEERVDSSHAGYVLIHFPEATVTNEYDQSEVIYDMFVKVSINNFGEYTGTLQMIRSRYTYNQATTGYVHSHLPIMWDFPEFKEPCLGNGPIRGTLTTLFHNPDDDLWELFCLELVKFIETESLNGGPYIRIGAISGSNPVADYRLDNIFIGYPSVSDEIKPFFDYLISKRPFKFNLCEGVLGIAMSPEEIAVTVSNLFIQWINENRLDSVNLMNQYTCSCVYSDGRIYILGGMSRMDNLLNRRGATVITFNGRRFPLEIIEVYDDNETHTLKLLHSGIIATFLKNILLKANYEYKNNVTEGRTTYI